MKDVITTILKEAYKTMAKAHKCSESDIINGLLTGNKKLLSELDELIGVGMNAAIKS